MLRSLFILTLVAIGTYYALQGPFYALLFYIGNAYFRPEDWVWTDLIKNLNLSFTIAVYLLLATFLFGTRFVLNGRIVLMLLFLLQGLLSTVLSEHSGYALGIWIEMLKVQLITYLIVILVTDFARFRLLILTMVLALGLEGAKQGWHYWIFPPTWQGGNPNRITFLGDNNGVAVGMLMLVPLVALLAQLTQRKWLRPVYWLLLVGIVNRALTTNSRGGFLAFLALGMIYWLRSRQKFRAFLGTIVVVAILLPTLPESYWKRMSTILTHEEVGEHSAMGRRYFWQVAIIMAKARPLVGVGPFCYNQAYDAYDITGGQYGHNRSVHSAFFGVLAELGYPGAALWLLIFFSALLNCLHVRRLSTKDPSLADIGKAAIALETGLLTYLVGGCFLPYQYQEMAFHQFALTIVLRRLAEQYGSDVLTSKSTQPLHGFSDPNVQSETSQVG